MLVGVARVCVHVYVRVRTGVQVHNLCITHAHAPPSTSPVVLCVLQPSASSSEGWRRREERSRRAARAVSEALLKGHTMLNEHCSECLSVLLKVRHVCLRLCVEDTGPSWMGPSVVQGCGLALGMRVYVYAGLLCRLRFVGQTQGATARVVALASDALGY